jgi:hypothetical protein
MAFALSHAAFAVSSFPPQASSIPLFSVSKIILRKIISLKRVFFEKSQVQLLYIAFKRGLSGFVCNRDRTLLYAVYLEYRAAQAAAAAAADTSEVQQRRKKRTEDAI